MAKMKWLASLAIVLTCEVIQKAHAKAAFAHFMVTNSENYTIADWESDMTLASNAHIDAFALNMAFLDNTNDPSLEMAFTAANKVGFKLFFSFDYAGNGPWDMPVVIEMIQKYGSNSAYFQHNSKPFVSTFEGPGSADDWITIKEKTGCFFMPDWSSVGAKPAMALGNGVADGLFSWAAWPWGNQTMDTYTDASYLQYLEGKPYMYAISPWFYTNLPGYNKNWIWKGDRLWFDRWQQLYALDPMPEFLQIISWNDYGESHYIGPLRDKSMAAFDIGQARYNFVEDYPHDGWRDLLPFLIDLYKTGTVSTEQDVVVYWYRLHPASACSSGSTTVNTASQLQIEFEPEDALDDRIYVMALLASNYATVYVENGKTNEYVEWEVRPDSEIGPGIYYGSVESYPGPVVVSSFRGDGGFSVFPNSPDITTDCVSGINNFNAWVGSQIFSGLPGTIGTTEVPLSDQECIAGKGAYEFNQLCNFTCSYGYCPVGACTCEQMGVPRTKPNATGIIGYPAEGRDANYLGLCNFACNYGYCPSKLCDTVEHSMPIPIISDFLPPACVAGTGEGNNAGLCSYACGFGYCPLHICTCTDTGALVEPPAQTEGGGMAALGVDSIIDNLCDFTCSRGYCPPSACRSKDDVSSSGISTLWDDAEGAECTDEQKTVIKRELVYAVEMATVTAEYVQRGDYHKVFFGDKLISDAQFLSDTAKTYERIAGIVSGNDPDFPLTLSCDTRTSFCKDPKTPYIVHMNDNQKRMNFCPKFFNFPQMAFTKDLLETCEMDLRTASRARAAAIVHEATHTSYAMLGKAKTRDIAYGFNSCYLLALGRFDRSCAPWAKKHSKIECPTTNAKGEVVEGLCDATFSAKNAESYQLVAAGAYFTKKCGHAIPLPSLPPIPPAASKRDTVCPVLDDYILWDDAGNEPIVGYAHFGDSFAAGLGTGHTSWGTCRVGSGNYGKQLYDSLDSTDTPYQNLACSGDKSSGLIDKVQNWKTPENYNMATVTIGGNNVNFADILKYCLLRIFNMPAHWDSKYCQERKDTAREMMDNKTLQSEIFVALLAIMNQKKWDGLFQLYVAGYPRFFNSDTTDCNTVTFRYWGASQADDMDDFLSQAKRAELNDLVDSMNSNIAGAVQSLNIYAKEVVAHFVDVNPHFEGHRWCEPGVKEPDPNNPSTYFFLSGWPDITEAQAIDASSDDEVNAQDVNAWMAAGKLPIPDGSVCNSTLGENPDLVDVWWCDVAQSVYVVPDGNVAQQVAKANAALASGDVTSQELGFFLPVRQLKTFHPRSAGEALYRDAVFEAKQEWDSES